MLITALPTTDVDQSRETISHDEKPTLRAESGPTLLRGLGLPMAGLLAHKCLAVRRVARNGAIQMASRKVASNESSQPA